MTRRFPPEALLRPLRLIAMDVDGVLTDGRITWGAFSDGGLVELKSFDARDGLGLSVLRRAGLDSAWITGRVSPLVERRARELDVVELCQRARDKRRALSELAERRGLERAEILYIGDDLNDLPAFDAAGVRAAVADAAPELRERADWITSARGGEGAVREVVETVLRAQGKWEEAVRRFLADLAEEHEQASRAPRGSGR